MKPANFLIKIVNAIVAFHTKFLSVRSRPKMTLKEGLLYDLKHIGKHLIIGLILTFLTFCYLTFVAPSQAMESGRGGTLYLYFLSYYLFSLKQSYQIRSTEIYVIRLPTGYMLRTKTNK
jgi:hypothetical protein